MQQSENTNDKKKSLFKRSVIKRRAKKNLKHHYVRNIIIVFLTAFIINGGYFLNTASTEATEIKFEDTTYMISGKKSNTQIIEDFFYNRADGVEQEHIEKKAYQQGLLKVFVNEITKSRFYIIWIFKCF